MRGRKRLVVESTDVSDLSDNGDCGVLGTAEAIADGLGCAQGVLGGAGNGFRKRFVSLEVEDCGRLTKDSFARTSVLGAFDGFEKQVGAVEMRM